MPRFTHSIGSDRPRFRSGTSSSTTGIENFSSTGSTSSGSVSFIGAGTRSIAGRSRIQTVVIPYRGYGTRSRFAGGSGSSGRLIRSLDPKVYVPTTPVTDTAEPVTETPAPIDETDPPVTVAPAPVDDTLPPAEHPLSPTEQEFARLEALVMMRMTSIDSEMQSLTVIDNAAWTSMEAELDSGSVASFDADEIYHQSRSLETFSHFTGQLLDLMADNPELASTRLEMEAVQNLYDDVTHHLGARDSFYVALEEYKLDEISSYIENNLGSIQGAQAAIEAFPSLNMADLSVAEQASIYHKQRTLENFMRMAGRDLDRLHRVDPNSDPYIAANQEAIQGILDFAESYFNDNGGFADEINQAQLNRIGTYIENNYDARLADMDLLDTMTLDASTITDATERAALLAQKNRLEIFIRRAGRDLGRIDLDAYSHSFVDANLSEIQGLVTRVQQHLDDNADFYSEI